MSKHSIGTWLSLPNESVAEIFAKAGYEWVVIDLEHSAININQADSLAFSALNGIGPIFSSRIVRYRNWLGGFHSKEQLLDVYGIDSMLFNHILPHLMVSSSDVKKININTANYSSLASHPYITKSIANTIIKYRNHHGNFTSLAELKLIPLIDEDLFRKIAFYLTIE